jgi:hypothetical protein
MNNFIGRGEETVKDILRLVTGLERYVFPIKRPAPGIYEQIGIDCLMKNTFYTELDPAQQKSSVDVVVYTKKHDYLCFRVQGGNNQKGKYRGHTGEHKARFDIIQKKYLEDSGCYVIDIHEWECQNIFKEKLNWMAIFELLDAMRRAHLDPGVFDEPRPHKRKS